MRHVSLPLALFASTLFSLGCYGYYRPSTAVLAGRQIEISLTDSGSLALAPQLGFNVEAVDGRLVRDSASSYLVSVTGIRKRDGQESGWKGESVSIPRTDVSTLQERRFSRARTTLFAAASTIAMVAVKRAFAGNGGATAPGGTPGGTGPK
jgi:hypothetical protein